MAACSLYVSYPSQFSSDQQMMNGQNEYIDGEDIRDELMFHPQSQTSRNSFTPDKRSSLLQDYFKSANALSRSIIMEKCSVEQQTKQWTVLSDSKRDEIVDKYFVPSVVREQYEAGLIGARLPGSKLSLHSASQDDNFGRERQDQVDGGYQPLSQSAGDVHSKTMSLGPSYNQRRSHSAAQLLDSGNTTANNTVNAPAPTSKSKLKSFSFRKKSSKKQKSSAIVTEKKEKEVLPSLFTRDVYELDNDVDLPDDSLLTDHIAVVEDDSFARLKPLRYSFGRKMRNKITHTPESLQRSCETVDGYPMNDNSLDYLDAQIQELTQGGNQLYNTVSTPDLLDRDGLAGNRAESISPINISDDAMSIASSRPSTRTPDSTNRVSPIRTVNKPFKESTHPLSRSVRAGSSYMTVTSSFADKRRQMFKKKKTSSNSPTDESTTTPITSPATSPPPPNEPILLKQHTPLKQTQSANATIPIIKTESVNESIITTSSSELPSPVCSPPSSPAGLCPNNNPGTRSKRESGYISSTYPEELSDDEEGSSRNTANTKRKPRRKGKTMHVERTDSFTNH